MAPAPSVSQAVRAGFHEAIGLGTEQTSNVLDDDQPRAELVDSGPHVGPQTGAGALGHPGAATSNRYVLARLREAARQNVDGGFLGNLLPVHLRDVVQVGDVGPVVGEDPRGGIVELAMPCDLGVVDLLDSEIQSTVQ